GGRPWRAATPAAPRAPRACPRRRCRPGPAGPAPRFLPFQSPETKRGRTRALPRCVYHVSVGSRHRGSSGPTLRRESALRLFSQRRKTRRVVHGDVRQHLAVQGDAGLGQAVHEAAVAQAVDAGRRVDAGDPQRTEVALLLLAANVGVLQCLRHRLLGDAEDLAARVVVTLGLLEDLLVTAARHHATLDSCHFLALLRDTEACGPGGPRPRHERGSSAAGCASAWSPSW